MMNIQMVLLEVLVLLKVLQIKLIGEKTMVVSVITNNDGNTLGSSLVINQNAINLFSNKINVKGSMIVEGTTDETTKEN